MANINLVKTDIDKETNGVWIEFAEGIQLKIARSRNTKYQEEIRRLIDPIKGELRKDVISTEKFADLLLRVRAKTVLLDWKNIEEDGVEVPYSVEKAIEYFKNPELKDFYGFVITISEGSEKYKKDIIKDSEKN